jgi:hypothetical protein
MGDSKIVRVDNEKFRVGGMAEARRYGFGLGRKR